MPEMKNVDYYKRLPYTRRVELVEDDVDGRYYVARIIELDGVMADGPSEVQASARLDRALTSYIEAMLEFGDEIPEPTFWPGVQQLEVASRPESRVDFNAILLVMTDPVRKVPEPRPVSPWKQGSRPLWQESRVLEAV